MAGRIQFPNQRLNPGLLHWEAQSLSLWTTGEVPIFHSWGENRQGWEKGNSPRSFSPYTRSLELSLQETELISPLGTIRGFHSFPGPWGVTHGTPWRYWGRNRGKKSLPFHLHHCPWEDSRRLTTSREAFSPCRPNHNHSQPRQPVATTHFRNSGGITGSWFAPSPAFATLLSPWSIQTNNNHFEISFITYLETPTYNISWFWRWY